jgi:uncharacterized protein
MATAAVNVPYLSGPVVDEVGLLSEPQRQALESMLRTLHQSRKVQMAILIPKSLQDTDIESYSMAVAEKWKLGTKGQDQGLLLVIAPNERKMRLEVGGGLEGDITDVYSKHLLTDVLRPYFRNQRYADGIMVVVEKISGKLGVDLQAPVQDREQSGGGFPWEAVLILIFVFLYLGLQFFRPWWWMLGGGGGGWGGGDGGGFSGGGGGFSGGGASSDW